LTKKRLFGWDSMKKKYIGETKVRRPSTLKNREKKKCSREGGNGREKKLSKAGLEA